jgi:hypothetical protein
VGKIRLVPVDQDPFDELGKGGLRTLPQEEGGLQPLKVALRLVKLAAIFVVGVVCLVEEALRLWKTLEHLGGFAGIEVGMAKLERAKVLGNFDVVRTEVGYASACAAGGSICTSPRC